MPPTSHEVKKTVNRRKRWADRHCAEETSSATGRHHRQQHHHHLPRRPRRGHQPMMRSPSAWIECVVPDERPRATANAHCHTPGHGGADVDRSLCVVALQGSPTLVRCFRRRCSTSEYSRSPHYALPLNNHDTCTFLASGLPENLLRQMENNVVQWLSAACWTYHGVISVIMTLMLWLILFVCNIVIFCLFCHLYFVYDVYINKYINCVHHKHTKKRRIRKTATCYRAH